MTSYTARALSTDKLQWLIVQNLHGLVVGNIVRFNGTNYVTAQADTFTDSQTVGMVSSVIDVNTFVVTQAGRISGLPATIVEGGPLVAGTYYYLSPATAGDLTATKTVVDNQVVVPCFIADTTTSGFYFNNAGIVNVPGGQGTFHWNVATVNTNTMLVNNGYIINGVATLTMTMPAASNPGDVIEIAGFSANGWIMQLQGGQTVHFGNVSTSAGGTIASTNRYDAIKVVCVVATTDWLVLSATGNLTIT